MGKIFEDSREKKALLEKAGLGNDRLSLMSALVHAVWKDEEEGITCDSVSRICSVSIDEKDGQHSIEVLVQGNALSFLFFSEETGWQIRTVMESVAYDDVQVNLIDEDAYRKF